MRRLTEVERAAAEAGEQRDRDLRHRGEGYRVRGVVHTPLPLARFVAKTADDLLRARLGLRGGLGDRRVALVDPACGPGVFLAAALGVLTPTRLKAHGPPAAFLGLDVDPQAIVDAERVLDPGARALGVPLRLRVADTLGDLTPFGADLAPDAVVVVMGNPPWAGRTANRDAEATSALLDDFRRDDDGVRLDERKLGVLSDDYVRFFRWSAEIVRRSPAGGVVALVTNGSYLDGVVHRGMRAALTRWFDGIDVIDLGGSALVAHGGSKDENVFGVRPSVAITCAFRAVGMDALRRARVRVGVLGGTRAEKLDALSTNDVALHRVPATAPAFLFRPQRVDAAWATLVPLDRAMPFHAEGVQTNRDDAVIDRDRGVLLARLARFADGGADPALEKARVASAHYDPARARDAVGEALARDPKGMNGLVRRIAYRPFDVRWFATVTPFCHRPRPALLDAIDEATPVLLTVRKDRGRAPWTHFAASVAVPDNCFLSARSSCRTRAFPVRTPAGEDNLAPDVRAAFEDALAIAIDARDFVRYALAMLAAPAYRGRFEEHLHTDYPRVPVPRRVDDYRSAVRSGEALVQAFSRPDPSDGGDEDEVAVGHHRVRSSALVRAIADAERACVPILADLD